MPEWIAEALTSARRGEALAMVTIVGAQGSTPREAGARMLVWPDRFTGTIGGGSLDWSSPLGTAAILVVVFYVADRVILKIYPRYFQRAFHTHSKLDGRVRTFIARRNITLPIFIVGYALGFGVEAFYLVTAWQILTALYHGGRTFWILAIDRAHLRDVKPTDVASALTHVD